MTLLSLAVAALSIISFGVWWSTANVSALLLGVAGLLCAGATFKSARISTFLKIFIVIFASEVVVFGGLFLLSVVGLWPESLKAYKLPDSVALTVAMFGILVWAMSHLKVVRSITAIADRYFESENMTQARIWPFASFQVRESRLAIAAVVFLVVVNQAQVGINVRLSFFNRDWFNAIQNKDQAAFWSLLYTVFLFWVAIYIVSAIIEFIAQSILMIRWRRWLTEHYVGRWLNGSTHYRMGLKGLNADNPDQRIAEDVNRFIDGGQVGYGIYSYSILLISTLSSLVSFAVILWTLSADFTIPGTDIAVPGFLFWVALIYSIIGTLITHVIGRSLVGLYFDRQRNEADFRFSLARLREYSEQIALLKGEAAERRLAMGRFGRIFDNYLQIVDRRKRLMAFTSTYGQISPFIPYIVAAPFYFAGKIQLGVMSQTAGAFNRVEGALNFFVTYYTSLADFKAVLDRLSSFDAAIDQAHEMERATQIVALPATAGEIGIAGLDLALPDGRVIVTHAQLTFQPGEAVLLSGHSGSGKSTLFRAVAGVWPFGKGVISVPAGASVMLLPQKPYIPIGTLRNAVTYPQDAAHFDDAALRKALENALMGPFIERLDEEDNWSQRLSGGEQQRLAVARALLARPDWLFLDEATSALDEPTEAALYRLLADHLPGTTLVSIGHRSTLAAFHQRRVVMEKNAEGAYTPVEQAKTAAAE